MSASIVPVNRPINHRRRRENLPPNPAPSSARPDTGNHVAYSGIPRAASMTQISGGSHAGGSVDYELRTLRAGVEIGDGIVVSRDARGSGGQTRAARNRYAIRESR